MNLVEVILWDKLVGVLFWDNSNRITSFEFSKDFIRENLEVSPIVNPLSGRIIKASKGINKSLNFDTNKGLPLFISDSLPDKFGTDLFAKYLEKEGRIFNDLSPLEKLSYIGNRGMGALEFRPNKSNNSKKGELDLKKLNDLSQSLIKNEPVANLGDMTNLFHVGTSPGGAQPKVLINIDKESGDIFRGDNFPNNNQDSWILKFNKDIGLDSDSERGKIEYVYYLIAKKCGINIMESKLLEIENEQFFMTKRFDRVNGEKLHTQTLNAFAGMNFMLPNTYSYEQVFTVLNKINLDYPSKEQIYRTLVFNVIGRNVDDHTKNFGFNMNKNGEWQLSPTYDLTFTYNNNYNREIPHFLSINGKNEKHTKEDLIKIGKDYSIKKPIKIIDEIIDSFSLWDNLAEENKISKKTKAFIQSKLLLKL